MYDFSNFWEEKKMNYEKKYKLIFFQNENTNDFIKKFIGLRSKLYVIKTAQIQQDKKCKGYNRKIRYSIQKLEKYKECYEGLNEYVFPLISIRREDQQLHTLTKYSSFEYF